VLAAHHAGAPGGARELFDLAGRVVARAREDGEGVGEQAVAGEHRGGLVVDLVHGGPATAQVVVVHGGQIVVHQRVGVHQLEGHGRRQGVIDAVVELVLQHARDAQAHEGAQALAAAEQRPGHRLAQASGRSGAVDVGVVLDVVAQGGLDPRPPRRELKQAPARGVGHAGFSDDDDDAADDDDSGPVFPSWSNCSRRDCMPSRRALAACTRRTPSS
jgi:hypothetical protein